MAARDGRRPCGVDLRAAPRPQHPGRRPRRSRGRDDAQLASSGGSVSDLRGVKRRLVNRTQPGNRLRCRGLNERRADHRQARFTHGWTARRGAHHRMRDRFMPARHHRPQLIPSLTCRASQIPDTRGLPPGRAGPHRRRFRRGLRPESNTQDMQDLWHWLGAREIRNRGSRVGQRSSAALW